jgi:inosine-uridine nucleoside N-ribohydrolase
VTATKIVLDTDPGHDDAIALLLALASPELELLGVTTVSGNQTLEKTTVNALKILELAGRTEIPVHPGAARPLVREQWAAAYVHGESGLDGPNLPDPKTQPADGHAVDFLARTLEQNDGVVIVPVGPLTNIGLLLALDPGIEELIGGIVLMGGAIAEGNVTPAAEFNVWADPEAAHRVFTSGIDVTMVGLDVTHRALLLPEHADQLRGAGRVGEVVAQLYDFYHGHHVRMYGWEGSPVHDALAVVHVIRDDFVRTEHRHVLVDTGPEPGRGRTYVDLWKRTGNDPNAHVGVDVDGPGFIRFLVQALSSLGRPAPSSGPEPRPAGG